MEDERKCCTTLLTVLVKVIGGHLLVTLEVNVMYSFD